MSISPGTKLAHYEILEPIGRGGMGEVYRARDATLDRDVAIKVLPEAFALDEERLRRFRREAKVLASLNHPNIAMIYGFEQSGSTSFLAMEYVSGETLAERIARGPVPVADSLEVAKQIAAALEEAHARGIVHRDLKPANVKLTENDQVKVLDFGLAKAFAEDGQGEGESAAASLSPTITRDATRAGVILGTAAYMSPEQAKGKPVDKRADIWAFGAVLYEMLTSRRAFVGEDISDTLAAILRSEPDWEALPREFPSSQRAYLKRCLAKSKSARIRDIGDLRLALDGAFEIEPEEHPTAATPTSQLPVGLWASSLIASAILTGVIVWTLARPTGPADAVSRFAVAPPEGVRIANRGGFDVIISPDGARVAYLGERDGERRLYVRAMGELEAKELPGTESADDPFFSPDGRWIGFESSRQQKLMRVPLDGGPLLSIGDYEQTRGVHWGEEGILFATRRGLWRIPPSGGEPESILTGSGSEVFSEPRILPGGRGIVFAVQTGPSREEEDIGALSLDSGERSILVRSGSNPYFAASGHLLFERGYTLMTVRFDPRTLRVTGDPVPVVNNVRRSGSAAADYAVSDTGTLVYIPGGESSDRRTLVWISPDGEMERIPAEPRSYYSPRVSHDGERIAAIIADEIGRGDIWEISGSRLTRLTFDGDARNPIFIPNTGRLFYVAEGSAGSFVFTLTTGGNRPEELVDVQPTFRLNDATRDGHFLFGSAFSQETQWDIVVAESGREPRLLLGSRFSESHPTVSPDGTLLAYVSDESGRPEVYATPFPEPTGKVAVSTEGGTEPAWSPDGREIFFRNRDAIWTVAIQTGDSLRIVGRPERRFEVTSASRESYVRSYDVDPSGDRVLVLEESSPEDVRIHTVLNWTSELERLLPSR